MTNLAYDLRDQEVQGLERGKKKKVKKKVEAKKSPGQKYALKLVVFLSILGVIALNVLNNYSTLTNIKNSIEVKKRNNSGLEKEIKLMEAKIEEVISPKIVEEIASQQLGMIYPSDENKIYINSREQEYVKERPKKTLGFMGLFTK